MLVADVRNSISERPISQDAGELHSELSDHSRIVRILGTTFPSWIGLSSHVNPAGR